MKPIFILHHIPTDFAEHGMTVRAWPLAVAAKGLSLAVSIVIWDMTANIAEKNKVNMEKPDGGDRMRLLGGAGVGIRRRVVKA